LASLAEKVVTVIFHRPGARAIGLAARAGRVKLFSAVAENQPVNKHRMNNELSSFATRLRELILNFQPPISDGQFSKLAMELFSLQFKHNPSYKKICIARGLTPQMVAPAFANATQIA
jgi:hypothetical protein